MPSIFCINSYCIFTTMLLCGSALCLTLSGNDFGSRLDNLRNIEITFPIDDNPDYYDYHDYYDASPVDSPDPVVADEEPLRENEFEVLQDDLDNTEGISSLADFLSRLGHRPQVLSIPEKFPVDPFGLSLKFGGGHSQFAKEEQAHSQFAKEEHAPNVTEVRFIEDPVNAFCTPELRTVELPVTNTAGTTFFPLCTRLHRCGGCCPNSQLLECQPKAVEELMIRVVKATERDANAPDSLVSGGRGIRRRNRTGPGRRRRDQRLKVVLSYVNVSMENHTSCECQCRIKESDCDLTVQKYEAGHCACVCMNSDSEAKCRTKEQTHQWNTHSCSCNCIDQRQCANHQEFDNDMCQCINKRDSINWGGEIGSPGEEII